MYSLGTVEVRDTHIDGIAQDEQDCARVPLCAQGRRELGLIQTIRELIGGQPGGAQLEQLGDHDGFGGFNGSAACGFVVAIAVRGARAAGGWGSRPDAIRAALPRTVRSLIFSRSSWAAQ